MKYRKVFGVVDKVWDTPYIIFMETRMKNFKKTSTLFFFNSRNEPN